VRDVWVAITVVGGAIGIVSYVVMLSEFEVEDRVEMLLLFLFPIGVVALAIRRCWKDLEWNS